MKTFTHNLARWVALIFGFCLMTVTLMAQQGTPLPATSGMSDMKPGSLLFYPYYTSNIISPYNENTRINLTNTHATQETYLHVFFVDSTTCQAADSFFCLTANQTLTLIASDYDPGITGYFMAVAVNKNTGVPIQFNYLLGSYYFKLAAGFSTNLSALSFAALTDTPAAINADGSTIDLKFNDVNYNAGPRTLGIDSLPSRADGNSTMLILTRLGGDLAGGQGGLIGGLLGQMFDDNEKGYSFSMSGGTCQFRNIFTDANPRMVPRFSSIVKAGHVGWVRMWPTANIPIVGIVVNHNANTAIQETSYSGGHNLHSLATTATGIFTIPVFLPSC